MHLKHIPFKLSLISDEFSSDLDGQIDVAQKIGVSAIDMRSIGELNVSDMSRKYLDEVIYRVKNSGLSIASLASSLGKRPAADEFMADSLFNLLEVCVKHKIPNIRIFGKKCDYWTGTEAGPLDWIMSLRDEVAKTNVELVVEPERGTGIDDPLMGLHLLKVLRFPNLKLVWDSGNFVMQGYRHPVTELYDDLNGYIGHIHVKDFSIEHQRACRPGDGEGQITELLQQTFMDKFTGWVSLEPQLARDNGRYLTPMCALMASVYGFSECWARAGAHHQSA